jgi:hypothetical protein
MHLAKITTRTLTRGYCIAAVFLIAGCAGVTDVVSTGPDTYMVASHSTMGWSSGGAQKAKAFQEADAFCKALGKQVQTINSTETAGGFGKIAGGEVEFRCIKPDDSALKRTSQYVPT